MTPTEDRALRPDRIVIEGLTLRTVIGIYDFERDRRQDVAISLEIETDIRAAGASDDVSDALDYKSLTKRVIDRVESSSCYLLEALAERIAATVLEEPLARSVTVRVDKPGALRHARTVGIVITRTRQESP